MVNNTSHVKLSNVELIRTALLEKMDTKVGLAARTGLSPATCATIVNELERTGEALRSDEVTSSGGRPAHVYSYNPHFAHILALYVTNESGDNRIVCATFTSTGGAVLRETLRPPRIDADTLESTVAELIRRDPLVKCVGVGIPGVVHEGVIGLSDIPALRGVALADRVRQRFGVAVVVENDMNLAAYGYYHRHLDELDSLAVVMLPRGNGPGTGIIVDGRILHGHRGFAGEVHYLPENYNPLFQAATDDSAFVGALARMLATVIALVDPQRIVLTGELVKPSMMEPLAHACAEVIPTEHCPEMRFQADCSEEYLEGLRLRAHESLRYRYRLAPR